MYHTKLEKLDPINDLAKLKVLGIEADPTRAVEVDTTTLAMDQEFVGYGHPGGSIELWASPGRFRQEDGFENLLKNDGTHPDLDAIKKLESSINKTTAREARQYLEAPRLEMIMNIDHGNSGSPVFDQDGKLRAVVADRVNTRHSLDIPADKVQELITKPESIFVFKYQEEADGSQKLVSISRSDGTSSQPIVLRMPDNSKQGSLFNEDFRGTLYVDMTPRLLLQPPHGLKGDISRLIFGKAGF